MLALIFLYQIKSCLFAVIYIWLPTMIAVSNQAIVSNQAFKILLYNNLVIVWAITDI